MKSLVVAAAIVFVSACYYRDPQVSVGYNAGYHYGYAAPSMTYISPGVQVVMDYDYPVFHSDGYYWRYDGGLWYRSGYYNRGWNVWYDVPHGVRGISRPEGYVRYRGSSSYQPNQNWGRRNVAPTASTPAPRNSGYQPNQNWGRRNAAPTAPTYRAPAGRGRSGGEFRPSGRPIVRDHR